MSDIDENSSESSEVLKTIQIGAPKKKELPKEMAPHKWKKGVSGNPNGRPKGSRNKLTILREAVLEKAETMVLNEWEELVKTTIQLAKAGDSTCIKILWDRVIPAKRAVEEKDGKEDKLTVNIVVKGMEVTDVFGEKTGREEKIIEGDYEEVE